MAFSRSLAVTWPRRSGSIAWLPAGSGPPGATRRPDDWQERAAREAPLGRWGTPDDVARVARFLVGPESAFVTGQIVRVNGGAVR